MIINEIHKYTIELTGEEKAILKGAAKILSDIEETIRVNITFEGAYSHIRYDTDEIDNAAGLLWRLEEADIIEAE